MVLEQQLSAGFHHEPRLHVVIGERENMRQEFYVLSFQFLVLSYVKIEILSTYSVLSAGYSAVNKRSPHPGGAHSVTEPFT